MLVAKLVSLVKSNKTIYRSAGGCEPWIVRCGPDVYVATTPQIAEWVKSQDGGIQVELIPNGVDRTMFKTSGMKYRLSGRKPIVLCVAADEPAKRVELARSAAKLASMSFVHVGGKYRVSHSEMPKCYRGCNVFTLPSLDEPFGIVYLEAMACGVPVVAPDDESRRFVVGKNGILCDVTDSKKYARALKMACSVKIKFDEKFDWKNVALRYKELFLRVL
jgi:glycosyltransferase involved in cell wall biosynthesis